MKIDPPLSLGSPSTSVQIYSIFSWERFKIGRLNHWFLGRLIFHLCTSGSFFRSNKIFITYQKKKLHVKHQSIKTMPHFYKWSLITIFPKPWSKWRMQTKAELLPSIYFSKERPIIPWSQQLCNSFGPENLCSLRKPNHFILSLLC